jgi:hypothetical protein
MMDVIFCVVLLVKKFIFSKTNFNKLNAKKGIKWYRK